MVARPPPQATFYRATSFNGDLSRWNVSRVTDMFRVFSGAKAFTGAGIGCWDVSSVTTMQGMFSGATSFNRQLGGAWSGSTANQFGTFDGSGGSIA